MSERISEIIRRYPEKAPVYVEDPTNTIKKNKYLVPREHSLGQFLSHLRRNAMISANEAIFIFIGERLPMMNQTIGELHDKYKSEDLMLYLSLRKESTFGNVFTL